MMDPIFDPHDVPDIPLEDRGYGYLVGTELFLIRHGQSMTNVFENLMAYDPNLTALGWAQALRVGAYMAQEHPVDVVVSSPLRRAHSTALAVAHAQGLEVITMAGLEEFFAPFYDEMPLHHPTRPWWGRSGWTPTPEGAPGFTAFRDRVLAALAEILERWAGKRICVVSHGGSMGVITAAMVGSQQLSVWQHNTGISHFLWPEWKRWMVMYINRREHLLDLNEADYPHPPETEPVGNGFYRIPEGLIQSWSDLPAHPQLAFLSNRLRRTDRILFIQPPDPLTPLRVSLRSRTAVILSDDLQLLEAGELRRAVLNANHIRYQYLFLPLPYPNAYFDYVVIPEECRQVGEEEIARVAKETAGAIRYRA
ncbi:MAG TPA: histidine phosphatase family protein [Anaerolineae bacterium]|nr:histidine phosphatase family protein [Anaerolineae bacterium]